MYKTVPLFMIIGVAQINTQNPTKIFKLPLLILIIILVSGGFVVTQISLNLTENADKQVAKYKKKWDKNKPDTINEMLEGFEDNDKE